MKTKKRIHYKNPTIIEAVIEVRFATLIDNHAAVKAFESKYECKKDNLVAYTALFQPDGVSISPNRLEQIRLRFAIKEQVSVQLYPDKFSFHWVGKYPGWDIFQPEFERFWKELCKIFPDLKGNRVGVRFINLVEQKTTQQKIGYWLKKSTNYPQSILSAKTGYFYTLKKPLKKGRSVQIFIAEGEPRIEQTKPLIFDIDIVENIDKSTRSSLANITESLHEEISTIFQGSISINYKKLLKRS